jgi:queuine tRNA-ribosyltransferase
MSKESLGGSLVTLHNLRFYVELMEHAREQILLGNFEDWAHAWLKTYSGEEA